jgi:ParB family transcriptional regulator, chromosome partitioning protein
MTTRDSQTLVITEQGKIIDLQERPLGQALLHTYRTRVDIDDILPNENQPRLQPGEYEELQRQIEANDGLFEPILVEPHPDVAGMFRIIDGHRRWVSCCALVAQGKSRYRQIPVEITDRTLSEEERLCIWIYTHHQGKEWGAGERELVARRLVDFVGQARAANILGITGPELEQLVETSRLWPRSPAL